MTNPHTGGFHIEINSIEEFVAFCAALQGGTLDDVKIQKLITTLRTAREKLAAAERAAEAPPKP